MLQGSAGKALARHKGMKFTTKDADNDISNIKSPSSSSWAVDWNGAWWYDYCHKTDFNGLHLK